MSVVANLCIAIAPRSIYVRKFCTWAPCARVHACVCARARACFVDMEEEVVITVVVFNTQ